MGFDSISTIFERRKVAQCRKPLLGTSRLTKYFVLLQIKKGTFRLKIVGKKIHICGKDGTQTNPTYSCFTCPVTKQRILRQPIG